MSLVGYSHPELFPQAYDLTGSVSPRSLSPQEAHQYSTNHHNDSHSLNEVSCCGGGASFDDEVDADYCREVSKKDSDEGLG